MAKKKKFEVSVAMPDGCTVTKMRAYIRDAIKQWSGQFHDTDPLFYAFDKRGSLTIKSIKSTEFYKQRNSALTQEK